MSKSWRPYALHILDASAKNRNILVHNYLRDIDGKTVEQVIDHQLGPVEAVINTMLESESG